ncbi:MAG: SOS response-associated peptidase [Lentimicrobium sp.]|nr:SOS response-associated peptidase [Lentimicrobium sp.]
MCGRFSLTTEEQQLNEFFRLAGGKAPYVPRYNGAPTQQLPVITDQLPEQLQLFRWGLIPFWSKQVPRNTPIINARAEGITEKPAFRQIFKNKRCLVPADGFYEWVRQGSKIPYRFTMKDDSLFAMAGLWDSWKGENEHVIHSFTIITTDPNELMRPIHDRMPVILDKSSYETWLGKSDEDALKSLLKPYPADSMKLHRVSEEINSVKNEGPGLLIPKSEMDLFS